jgi:hypothetical protein
MTQGGGHSCTAAIDRINQPPPDFRKILSEKRTFVDETFTPADMVYWADYPSTIEAISLEDEHAKIIGYYDLFDRYPNNSLFGVGGPTVLDTAQSQYLGDCYYISGVMAFAQKTESYKRTFVIQEVNDSKIMVFNIYIRGKPHMVAIDSLFPFVQKKGTVIPAFAQIGFDGALSGPLLEKLWAKINGSYERTAAGW